jgi:RHS repeat-associated protein
LCTNLVAGDVATQYVFNADSVRVKKVVGSTATYYVGNWYEVTNGTATKYYYFGAQRVAMRNANGVTYLHGDHLGSTSVTSGAQPSSQTYYPYGGVRSGTLPTDYTFTGQKADSDGLMYYNARYYDSAIGRFTQPDTIVPNPYNPQDLNRYSYARNNPLKFIDPSGHEYVSGADQRDQLNTSGSNPTDPFKDYVMIGVCGAYTDCPVGSDNPSLYNQMIPLAPLKTWFESLGGTFVYVQGKWTGTVQDVLAMSSQIHKIIEESVDAIGFFIVGHSLGANGVVAFASQSTNDKIKGLALLDPDLVDFSPASTLKGFTAQGFDFFNSPATQQTGDIAVGTYSTFVVQATSKPDQLPTHGFTQWSPNWAWLPEPPGNKHTALAVDQMVAEKIINYMLSAK